MKIRWMNGNTLMIREGKRRWFYKSTPELREAVNAARPVVADVDQMVARLSVLGFDCTSALKRRQMMGPPR